MEVTNVSSSHMDQLSAGVSVMSEMLSSFNGLPEYLKRCLLYTCLFPRNFEFDKNTLVQLWMAVGFIHHTKQEELEGIGNRYFEDLLSRSFFQEPKLDCLDSPSNYKVHDNVYNLLQQCFPHEYARVEEGKAANISMMTMHSSILGKNTDRAIIESLYEAEILRTLIFFSDSIENIPSDLFSKLRFLRVLDLSCTGITELPDSIGKLNHLNYLDLSKTLIKKLPESVTRLRKLQTLKLKGCLKLAGLPNDMNKLINLKHLDLDVVRQLTSMPSKMGRLKELVTLKAFIVGRESGFQICELKHMSKLRGELSIVNLENVLNVSEAREAQLTNKTNLNKLEYRWSRMENSAREVLEHLEPNRNLSRLKILCYGGDYFPNWLGKSSFTNLVTVSLSNCRKCKRLPSLGQLPSLISLHIEEMHEIERIEHQFCGHESGKGFPKLETLEYDGLPQLKEWTGLEAGEMPCLNHDRLP